MREPQTWYDKGLLEDEPFLSAFKARQIAGPPARQCTGKDDDASRNVTIAKEIKERNLLKVVQAWLDLAFKPHRNDIKLREVKVDEPGMLNLFVQFYWMLSHDYQLAAGILENERKRRGYEYTLDTPTQQGASLASTADLKKAHTKQKRITHIRNNVIDKKTKARPLQREDIGDKSDHISNGRAPRGQLPPKEVNAGSIPAGLKFNENLGAKKGMPEREKSPSQSCRPSLDPTSDLSERQDSCQIELNSSTLPLPPDPQNTAVCDLPLLHTRKRRQTSPDTRRAKHRKINEATSDTRKLYNVFNASISTQLASTSTKPDNQVTNFRTGDNLKPRPQASSRLKWNKDTLSPNYPPLASARCDSKRRSVNKIALSLPPNAPNIYNPQGGLEAHPAQGERPILPKKTPVLPPRPKGTDTELRHVSKGAINGQLLDKRMETHDRVDSSQKKLKLQKNSPSDLQSKRQHLSVEAIHNLPNRGRCAATDGDAHPAKERQGPQTNGVVANKKAIDTNYKLCNVPNGLTSDQILNDIKRPGRYAKLRFNRVSNLETSQRIEGNLPQGCPLVLDSRTDDSTEGQNTSVSRVNKSVLLSFSDQCNTSSAICDTSNPCKRRSSSLDGENYAVASKEVSVGMAERAITTSHRETKRRKIIQGETMAESVKDGTTPVPAHKQSRGRKGTRTKNRAPFKVESPDRFMIRSKTHPATDLPPVNERLSHQHKQDETTGNPRRRRASSPEDGQHKRQGVAVSQGNPVPITVQPELVKKRRGRPPKIKASEQEGSVVKAVQPEREKGRPPKSKVLSLAQAQLNVGMAVPARRHDLFGSQEIVEELSHHDNIPRSMLNRSMKEESINSSENCLLAQEHGSVEEDFTLDCVTPAAMEDHPTGIFPTRKPPLGVKPPIWAQSRQEVCETFDWFRSYQGGVYFAHNMVKGYLLSAFSSKRDRFEHGGRLIISHGGGKAESLHTRKGQTTAQPAADQLAQDKSVRALLDNYRNQRPLVLLVDDKYVLFPYDLGARDITYVVLGFYTIAHAWAEYQPADNETGRVVRYKFAFRWCDDQGSPWWLTDKATYLSDLTPPSTPATPSFKPTSKRTPTKKSKDGQDALRTTKVREAVSSEPNSFECELCHMCSPRVYTRSWVCLHPNCSRFWRDIKGKLLPDNLEYDFNFLKLMASLPIPPGFGKLKPDLSACLSTDSTVTNYAFTRGFHCSSCGRLSCRFKWEKWECMSCGDCLQVSGSIHKAKDFWSNLLPIGYKDHFISKISKIKQQPVRGFRHENGMGSVQSFVLPDGRGKIHHIQPGTPLGRLEADDIFIEYQQQATVGVLKFRRWPLRSHKCRGALLTNYFSQNSGEPYQYVGGAANTVPFENAPGAVVKARALIQKRIRQALEMHVEFNEVLSAAYMERQKMAFHSDSEIGLGPVVAGLSLGSPALMHFRIHAKHDPLRAQKGNLLTFVLRHGDVLVMDGTTVQEYYEHTVIPNNFRIAATARQINPGHT